MNATLIRNWNARVKLEDTVFHLGDFCFKNSSGATARGEGGLTPAQDWEKKLNGKVIHIAGNHDKNNGVRNIISFAVIEYGGKKTLLVHDPSDASGIDELEIDLILCGHVHEKWLTNAGALATPMVNVGVDVWKFKPISFDEILKVLNPKKSESP